MYTLELTEDDFNITDLQKEITSWSKETFGDAELKTMIERFTGEVQELVQEGLGYYEGNYMYSAQATVEECADCLHLLFQIADYLGYDLLEETRKKFEINKQRKWKLNGDGTGQHV